MKISDCLFRIWIALMAGTAFFLCLSYFIENRSLWLDEAFLAMNIPDKSWFALWLPLDYLQVAPPLFLTITKFFYLTLPLSVEQTLRFFPLLCTIGSILLFLPFARLFLPNRILLAPAFALFCLNSQLIYFSQEFKQYAPDLFWGMLTCFLFSKIRFQTTSLIRLFYWGLAFGTLMLISQTTVFIVAAGLATETLCGGTLTLFPFSVNRRAVRHLASFTAGWLIPVALMLGLYLNNPHRDYMDFWWSNFGAFPQPDFGSLTASMMSLFDFLFYDRFLAGAPSLLFVIYDITLILFLVSLLAAPILIRPSRLACFLLFLFLAVLTAGCLHLYPFQERTTLYLLPFIIIVFCHLPLLSDYRLLRIGAFLFILFLSLTTLFVTGYKHAHHTLIRHPSSVRQSVTALRDRADTVDTVLIVDTKGPRDASHAAPYFFYKKHLNYTAPREVILPGRTLLQNQTINTCQAYFTPYLIPGQTHALIADNFRWPTACFKYLSSRPGFQQQGSLLIWQE